MRTLSWMRRWRAGLAGLLIAMTCAACGASATAPSVAPPTPMELARGMTAAVPAVVEGARPVTVLVYWKVLPEAPGRIVKVPL